MKTKHVVIIVLILSVSNLCRAQSTTRYFEQFYPANRVNQMQMKTFADSINRIGKEAIPLLIENIARSDKVKIGMAKPILSTLPVYYLKENYRGIRSAYFIEWMLWDKNPQRYDYQSFYDKKNLTLGVLSRAIHEYYRYNLNLLVKNEDKQLDYEDILAVKSIYEKWWEENQDLSIQELRLKYTNDSIWAKTPYRWE